MIKTLRHKREQDLIDELRRRFPLFEQVVGQFGDTTKTERIPWFFALLLAAAIKAEPGACCFVLDKTPGTTVVTAILLGLLRLQQEFPSLVEGYAHTALLRGQRVKVKPSDLVYEYEGPWQEFPGQFRLKVLGKNGWRNFPMSDVLRLEPTERLRPKGSLTSNLGVFVRSPLDELLSISAHGNNSMIRNAVLVYMAQVRFAEIAAAITLGPKHASQFEKMATLLPWGSIGANGVVRLNDDYQLAGEPLIAATRVPEDLALAASSAPFGTRSVLVDGATGLARDLQAFNDLVDCQRVVILASPDEADEVGLLAERGSTVWHMSTDEILLAEDPAEPRKRTSYVGLTIRAADTRRQSQVTIVDCEDDGLQSVSASLEKVARMIHGEEESAEVDEIVARIYGILWECSECCFGVGDEINSDLQMARERVARYSAWMEPAVAREFIEATDKLESIIVTGSGQHKANAFLNTIYDSGGQWAVAARSPRTAERLRERLQCLGINLPVLPVRLLVPDREYAGLILPAWPNRQKFTRLTNLAVTRDIRVLAYPFERKWVLRHQARERADARSNRITVEERSSVIGVDPNLLSAFKTPVSNPPVNEVPEDLPIFRIEERITRRRVKHPSLTLDGEDTREAQLVEFYGGCYSLLTGWTQLNILNELMDASRRDIAQLRTATISQLTIGDFVLFRAGGDKEFIRLLAEDSIGTAEYERIRSVSERWKTSLCRLGSTPAAVQINLARHGLRRTNPTVAGWMRNPDLIGPGDDNDIQTIAKAAGDTELLAEQDAVREAISRIRGAHIVAGKRLTQLILGEIHSTLSELGDQPVLLDLAYGQAWVVQVAAIEAQKRQFPLNQINRLLWVDDTPL